MTDDSQQARLEGTAVVQRGKDFGSRKMELIQLVEGRMGGDGKDTSSATLMRTPTTTVVIDTGSEGAREELLRSIQRIDLNVEKVNVMVATRIDPLFNGNDDIFVNALQHLMKDEWSLVPPGPRRKIAITDRFHWIDRYLKLEVINHPKPGNLVLLLHVPKKEELLAPTAVGFAGKIIGISGPCIPSEDDPGIAPILKELRKKGRTRRFGQTFDITNREELLQYCDHIIPAFGPMFEVIP
ncbi:MAG: hypothetical protein ACMUHU_06785 [Thermoplasmatota archaeon]